MKKSVNNNKDCKPSLYIPRDLMHYVDSKAKAFGSRSKVVQHALAQMQKVEFDPIPLPIEPEL